MTIPRTNPEMNKQIVGILRLGNEPSQYAAQRIIELEAENERLQGDVKQLRDPLSNPEFVQSVVEWAGEEMVKKLKAEITKLHTEIDRLQAEIERLEAVRDAAIRVVAQTTPDAAYQLHDKLIEAIEAAEAKRSEVNNV